MKIFLFKLAKVLIVIFIVANLLGLFLDYHIRKSNIFKVNIIFNQNLPENLILGSSRALTGINTPLLSKLTKRKWYNLGMHDTRIETHYLFYQLLIDRNKAPKNILLQYDSEESNIDNVRYFDNDFQLLPFINHSKVITEYFKPKSNYILFKFFPIAKYIYFNTELFFPAIMLFFKPEYQHRSNQFGDYNYPNNLIMKVNRKNMTVRKIYFENPLFKKLNNELNKKDIKFLVYTAPIFKVKLVSDKHILNYFDFSSLYSSDVSFCDEFHIANSTKVDFTKALSKELQKSYKW
jgi:hypothetical protein